LLNLDQHKELLFRNSLFSRQRITEREIGELQGVFFLRMAKCARENRGFLKIEKSTARFTAGDHGGNVLPLGLGHSGNRLNGSVTLVYPQTAVISQKRTEFFGSGSTGSWLRSGALAAIARI
jgi:hypothetical protein